MARIIDAIINIHPIHTMLVHFPIALTSVALLFLVLALWRREEVFERAAFFNIALVPIAAALSGLTGYQDHLDRFGGETPQAPAKIFLAISLIVLTTVITISRRRKPEITWTPSTMVLYVAGFAAAFAIAGTLGFLGGVILYGW